MSKAYDHALAAACSVHVEHHVLHAEHHVPASLGTPMTLRTKKDSQSLLLLCYDCLACFACFALLTQVQSRDDDDEHRTTNNVILVQDAVSPLVLRNLTVDEDHGDEGDEGHPGEDSDKDHVREGDEGEDSDEDNVHEGDEGQEGEDSVEDHVQEGDAGHESKKGRSEIAGPRGHQGEDDWRPREAGRSARAHRLRLEHPRGQA